MVTHYLDEALVLADKIFVLKEKKILNVVNVPFARPRTQAIRYTEEFQRNKQVLTNMLS